eukprot:Skav218247  [mRNA]  locus=scaffold1426:147835:148341:- [translate_table: standard]
MPCAKLANAWLKNTTSISAPWHCKQLESSANTFMEEMAGVSLEGLDREMHESFQALAPFFRPALEERKNRKRQKGAPPAKDNEENAGTPAKKLMTTLTMVTRLVLQHEANFGSLRSQDAFIFYMNHEPTGALKMLVQEGVEWRTKAATSAPTTPLKLHLLMMLLNELQ